ncbi:hypothetical protein [Sphingomonas sp.]|uniref:hypothetical protein n=1 Tax=Sphingomonas sp. TaxID=28214 RepID=UPI001E17BDA2|nr:hypothetical protein [Sphingomonas sp.]MBX9795594.1 hypothetical protein [Sphingomonas sp.]
MRAAVFALVLLAGCSGQGTQSNNGRATDDLESAAIAAGVIADPKSVDITGLYSRGTDQLCIVPSATAWSAGVTIDYGDNQSCSGQAKLTRSGETLRFSFDEAPGCAVDARFEGDRIVFPGQVPDACQRLCSRRASIAALDVERQSDTAAEAASLRDAKGKLLCQAG